MASVLMRSSSPEPTSLGGSRKCAGATLTAIGTAMVVAAEVDDATSCAAVDDGSGANAYYTSGMSDVVRGVACALR
jgi:hypothetical protein